jgi:LysM repeat protein
MLSGGIYQDESFSWRAEGIGHCFITLESGILNIRVRGSGDFALDPWEIIPDWEPDRQTILSQLVRNNPVEQAIFPAGARVTWSVLSGATYQLAMGTRTPPPDETEPEVAPNPGEHVILLADPNEALPLALPYIRHFTPDVSFSPAQAVGRWAYVSVIATTSQISDSQLEAIRAAGAQIVERIGDDTAAVLSSLITHNRRFLSPGLDNPPAEAPLDPPTTPPGSQTNLYTVQPGDSLSRIATQIYGQSSLWTLIFEANRDLLDNPNMIRPGMKLKIPPKP